MICLKGRFLRQRNAMTSSNTALTERVREFVARASPVPLERIILDSGLEGDLGIDTESATNFFAAFAWEFDVDVSELDIGKHFGVVWTSWGWLFFIIALPAAGIGYAVGVPLTIIVIVPLLVLWLGNRLEDRVRRRNSIEIRVKDLVEAAENRCW